MIRNLPLITLAVIFVAGMVLAGMALIQPLGFADSQIIPWPATEIRSDVQIVIDPSLTHYFVEQDTGKTIGSH